MCSIQPRQHTSIRYTKMHNNIHNHQSPTMKLEREILELLKKRYESYDHTVHQENLPHIMYAEQISTEIEKDQNEVIRMLQRLETRGYVKLHSYASGKPMTEKYLITDLGIRSLKPNYKEIISFSCIVLGAVSATIVLFLSLL